MKHPSLFVALLLAPVLVLAGTHRVDTEGGRFYEVRIPGTLSAVDTTNHNPVGVCYFRFDRGGGIPVHADDILASGLVPGDRDVAYEYLFADRAALSDGGRAEWTFQIRVPDLADAMSLDIRPWKNLAPIRLGGPTTVPCVPVYDYLGGDRHLCRSFRTGETDDELVLVGSLLTADGSAPIANCPVRAELSLWGSTLADDAHAMVRTARTDARGAFDLTMALPPGCQGGSVVLSVPGNNDRLRVVDIKASPRFHSRPLPSEKEPIVFAFPCLGAGEMTLAGHLVGGSGAASPKGAIASVAFLSAAGQTLRAERLPHSERFGNYLYLETKPGASAFRHTLKVPAGAERVEFRLSRFYNKLDIALEALSIARVLPKFSGAQNGGPPLSPEDVLSRPDRVRASLDAWLGPDMVEKLRTRADAPDAQASNFGLIMESGWGPGPDPSILVFRRFDGVPVSPDMDWSMDPFHSTTWQLKFLSCYWIPYLTANLPPPERYERCKALWQSFLRSVPYPAGVGPMSYNDHVAAARIEAILLTLYGSRESPVPLEPLAGRIAEDPEFFAQLLHQLSVDVGVVDYHLRFRTYNLHNHNLIMAKSLLVFSDCFAGYPFAKRYRRLAVGIVLEHLYGMFEPDGFIREQSAMYHHSFLEYFADLHGYLVKTGQIKGVQRREMRDFLLRVVEADQRLCPPDGMALPMGDTGPSRTRNALQTVIEQLEAVEGPMEVLHREDVDGPVATAYPESGVYVFRNPTEDRYLCIDISPVLKVHGHRDLGSWQYYAHGECWVSDLGGPYRYGSPEYRRFIASESHSVVDPVGRGQTSGIAYGVEFHETDEGWALEFETNVYGPEVRHRKRFLVRHDVTEFTVEEEFSGVPEGRCVGRVVLAPGVAAEINGAAIRLDRNGKNLHVRLSENCHHLHTESRDSSPAPNQIVPVETVVYSVDVPPEGIAIRMTISD